MADISKINLPNDANNPYNIADATARNDLADKMDKTNPTGTGSFSLNRKADTTIGTNSFAEGENNVASGRSSHAEGYNTTARGSYSHAEGLTTIASGDRSHVEGSGTIASGSVSHAENSHTTASGYYSHAEGVYTTANHRSQHVMGEYNVPDDSTAGVHAKGNYVEIVGNGTADDSRSNARTLDWSGNEVLSGTIEATGFGTTLDKEVDRGGVQLTQAQYDALVSAGTVDANTTYFITDANNTTASYAAGVTYDNTGSGLSATNVQSAIDEVNAKDASKIAYDNTSSGLNATDVNAAIDEVNAKTGSDIAVSSSSSETIAEALSALFLINTYTATVTVGANGVTALKGRDMGYNSIPSGYTPIDYSFSCVNSNDLFFNLSLLTATGSQQFGVIRNVSANPQNDKNCTIKIIFIKSAFL